jgi:hypothetical protein
VSKIASIRSQMRVCDRCDQPFEQFDQQYQQFTLCGLCERGKQFDQPPCRGPGTSREVVYYESRKRELRRRLINEGRCDERLKAKVEESTCLSYTGLHDKTI